MANKQTPRNRKMKRNPPKSEILRLSDALTRFNNHADPDYRIRLADRLARINQAAQLTMAGSVLLETATDPRLDITEKQELLGCAQDYWQEVRTRSRRSSRTLSPWASFTTGRLATFGSMKWLIAGDQIGPVATIRDDYGKLIEAGNEQLESQARAQTVETKLSIGGDIAETSVMLLLTRFALLHGEGEYLPTFSYLSEDQGGQHGSQILKRWDVSVFTQPDSAIPPERKYQLQVKSRNGGKSSDKVYDEDFVTMVYARDDLALGRNPRTMPLGVIVNECRSEADGEAGRWTSNLDARTDKLLDIMG